MQQRSSVFLFLITVLFFTGCSRTIILLAPEDLYALGSYHFEEMQYRTASDQFERIRTDYPTSEYAVSSQFKYAECLFMRKIYTKAAVEFEIFIEFNPAHKLAPQAEYFLAMSKFNSLISPERDVTMALEAERSLERFLTRYKDHPSHPQAEEFLSQVIDHLQTHELEVGKAYYRMGYYRAALGRLEPILTSDASAKLKQEVLFHIGKTRIRLDQRDEARDSFTKAAEMNIDGRFQRRAIKALNRM